MNNIQQIQDLAYSNNDRFGRRDIRRAQKAGFNDNQIRRAIRQSDGKVNRSAKTYSGLNSAEGNQYLNDHKAKRQKRKAGQRPELRDMRNAGVFGPDDGPLHYSGPKPSTSYKIPNLSSGTAKTNRTKPKQTYGGQAPSLQLPQRSRKPTTTGWETQPQYQSTSPHLIPGTNTRIETGGAQGTGGRATGRSRKQLYKNSPFFSN